MLSVTAQWLRSAEQRLLAESLVQRRFRSTFASARSEHVLPACTLHFALLYNMPGHILCPDTHIVMRTACCTEINHCPEADMTGVLTDLHRQ